MSPFRTCEPLPRRRGLSLAEMMVAMAVMAMIAAALSALAMSVEVQGEHLLGADDAVQHAQVAIARLERTLRNAHASESWPAYFVVTQSVSGVNYPNSLVVWAPKGAPVQAAGPPRFSELIVYTYEGSPPTQLVELSDPTDSRTAPAWTSQSTWRTEIDNLRSRAAARKVVLTPLVRAPIASGSGTSATRASAVRFEVEHRPTAAALAAYRNGTATWSSLHWAQDLFSSSTGTRQSWCRIELQVLPGERVRNADPGSERAIPFFGSAAVYYQVQL